MTYVALLRAVNVGGQGAINIKELAAAFAEAGMAGVLTYINSGNVIFATTLENRTKLTPSRLAPESTCWS